MAPKIINYLLCGMRHPTTGLNEDDLSRLTGSSSNSSSILTPSHDPCPHNGNSSARMPTCAIISTPDEQANNLKNFHHLQQFLIKQPNSNFNSCYLPEYIDPLEWQTSRKRKDRHDSNSSATQERKLVRSNSEELLSNADCEVIRRVSSSEDFKRPLHDITDDNILKTIEENDSGGNSPHQDTMTKSHARAETSPARNSPNRDYRRYRDNDETECENERRRSSERFCKSRIPPGRKVGVTKKSGKYIQKFRNNDENVYKYDISALKHERRGFVSQFKIEEREQRKDEGDQQSENDYNDNNLIDFHSHRNENRNNRKTLAEPEKQPKKYSSAEALPWNSLTKGDTVLSRRFEAMDDDNAANGLVEPQPQIVTNVEPVRSFRMFTKMENIKTREIMLQQSLPQISFETPEERLKYVNKKLTALKRKLALLEEAFEKKNGYRPSQVDKLNEKQIKCTLAEMNKLRKEKHELKADPMAALGLKIIGGIDPEKKIDSMKETLDEIEKKLIEKREECKRSACLDDLSSDQLVQEKTSVQHGLLYFESLYGRPATKEERDVARPLYDRYRLLKRMVSRTIAMSGSAGCASELPTILENEAMAFTFESVQPTSTGSNTPVEASPCSTDNTTSSVLSQEEECVSREGKLDETPHSQSSSQSLVSENVHTLSLNELCEQLEKARGEKHEVKRTIREYETLFEEQNGRKMLKTDRKFIEDTYGHYKELKAKVRLLQALVRKHTR